MRKNVAISIGIAVVVVSSVFGLIMYTGDESEKSINPDSSSSISPPAPAGRNFTINLTEAVGLGEQGP